MSKKIAAITPSRTIGSVTGTRALPAPAVEPVADTASVGELAAVGLVHTAEPTVALDAIDDAPVIGSRIEEVLIPDAHHPSGPKRLPPSIRALTTARVTTTDWRQDGLFADGDAN